MGNWKDVGSLSVLAAGLGIGAALATTPGVAFAGPSNADGGAGALGYAAALAAADIGDAAATIGAAAATITPPTLPSDFGNIAISISGLDLSLGTASASSSLGNFAFAFGDSASAYANDGYFNFASAFGDETSAGNRSDGSFNFATAIGFGAGAGIFGGDSNTATAIGNGAFAAVGPYMLGNNYDFSFNTATAEGAGALAWAGWEATSGNVASAIGDNVQAVTPNGDPYGPWPAAADVDLISGDSGADFWTALWDLFTG